MLKILEPTSRLYTIGLIGLVLVMPFSNVAMSVATFTLVGLWLIDQILAVYRKEWIARIRGIFHNPLSLLFLIVFVAFAASLLYSSDLNYGLRDLRTKVPLFVFPFIFSSMPSMSARQRRGVYIAFLIALFSATVACLVNWYGFLSEFETDAREASIFISHIRFSHFLVLGIALSSWLYWTKKLPLVVWLILVLTYLYFIYITQSFNAIVALAAVVLYSLFFILKDDQFKPYRAALGIFMTLGLSVVVIYTSVCAIQYFSIKEEVPVQVNIQTTDGEEYWNDFTNTMRENGYYVNRNIAWKELETNWNEKSNLAFNSTDKKGQPISSTLIRYVTSKGLKKDASGIAQLTPLDVTNIENGMCNVNEGVHGPFRERLHRLFFELHSYSNGGNPAGNSFTQRFEYWKTGYLVIKDHPLTGVGVGDVKNEILSKYDEMESVLPAKYRLRAHNQYLTVWMTLGFGGFLLFIFYLIFPADRKRKWNYYPYMCFWIITVLSFLTEDTLETQAGVTFFAFFNSFWILIPWKDK